MTKHLNIVTPLALAAIVTASCAQPEVDAAKSLDITGRDATAEAAREYKRLAYFESEVMKDRESASVYSKKAIEATHGKLPVPGITRKIDDQMTRAEVEAAYGQLAALMAVGADRVAPQATGQALARLDCWAEQAAEGNQAQHIALCRDGYRDYAVQAALALKAAGVAGATIPLRNYTVTFPSGSSEPAAGANAVLDAAAKAALADSRTRIVLGGHTDRYGSAKTNLRISEMRAKHVERLLIARGVPASRISTIGFGETYPTTVTPDGERNDSNRRVEIIIGPGGDI